MQNFSTPKRRRLLASALALSLAASITAPAAFAAEQVEMSKQNTGGGI